MDTKAMFNQFLELFSKQHSDSSGSGNIASAGDFEKFNTLMKWMNKEGTTKDDIPEGPISQAKLGGSHSEHDLMHEEDPDPMQMDDSSERSTNDSSSEKGSEERAEKGSEIEDDGQREGTGDGEEGKDDGETNDVLEQYFSKKQNPLKRKIHYLIRKTAKETIGVYGKKRLSKCPPAKKYMYDRVYSSCSEIVDHEQRFDGLLSRVLTQAKYYRKRHPVMTPTRTSPIKAKVTPIKQKTTSKRVKSKKKTKKTRPTTNVSEETGQDKVTTPSPYELICFAKRQTSNRLKQALLKYQRDSGDTSSSGFKPGDSVVIIRRGKEIGSAVFIEKQDELFAELAFSSHSSGHGTASDDGISLYKPVAANDMLKRAEVSFDQLEPNDLFSWKLENIKKKISRTLRRTDELKAVDRLYCN